MTKIDKSAGQILEAYVQRYELHRPQGSSPFPNLANDVMSGNGRNVYNIDGGGNIATFTTVGAAESAILACKRAYRSRTGRDWFAR